MNTKEELLQKLIGMPDVVHISKEGECIFVRLSTKFNNSNAKRFIDVLEGYKWEIENQYACLIKIRIIDEIEN